jgi:aminopeptidase N
MRALQSVCVVVGLLGFAPAQASAQRLPHTVIPSRYELTIRVDLASASFQGEDTIHVDVHEPTTAITLNAAEITFQSVTITAAAGDQRARVTLDSAAEQATFHVDRALPAGPATIRIAYKGVLNDQLRGLYLSRANNRRYAVSQLEATDARRMFPSFDEPAMKAEFALTAIVDTADHAISNGAIVSDTPGPGAGKHTIRFETTPKMSTYLVALAVGDFVCRAGGVDGTPIRVCATPDKQRLTGFALEAAEKNLHFYNGYYAITYPFKKLDIVAVPDFAAGAMENTAAIFYRETLLLSDPASSTARSRKVIAEVLAHEMAHQWFGDLVTMEWWDDIWLNEGFANWMETKPLRAWNPDWHSELDEVIANQEALRLDALTSTRPVRTKANTPAEINELFDAIAYNKGAAVLRMVEGYVGAAAFRDGVNAYLQQFQYGNARAEDFWTVMTRTTGKPVDKVMSGFVDQPGVPLVSVAPQCGGEKAVLTLRQERYRQVTQPAPSASQVWDIPACVRLPDAFSQCDQLDAPAGAMPVPTCPSWLIGNADGLGYYRVGYQPATITAIAAEISRATPSERISLLGDEWALVRAGKHDISVNLDLASAFAGDRHDVVVGALTDTLDRIGRQLTTDQSRAKYRQWVKQLLDPILREVGWTAAASETEQRKVLRTEVIDALGDTARDPDVLAKATSLAEQVLKQPDSLEPVLRNTVVQLAPLAGDRALYDRYLAAATAARDPDEHYRYLSGLARFSDPALVRRTIDLIVSPDVRPQDVPGFVAGLLRNPDAHDYAWTLVQQRWTELQKKIGSFGGNTAVVAALASFCDAERAADIRRFFAAHPVPDAQRTLQQALEEIDICAAVRAAQAPVLARWLDKL